MTICLVDTSIFCEILDVPHMAADAAATTRELRRRIVAREHMMLPMATIFETGNHIGQNGSGAQRRAAAQRFVKHVAAAIRGESPFTATRFVERDEVLEWLERFPDWAKTGSGLGDLSILREWELHRATHPGRRVYIWTLDADLSGYDSES